MQEVTLDTTKTRRPHATAPPGFIDTRTAAKILGRSTKVVGRLGKNGHLRMNRVGRCVPFFNQAEVEAMAREMGVLSEVGP
jgi:hypothetical protein